MKFVRISSLVIGLSMILQWIFFLITGNVPEFETEPIGIIFHITIEIITALLLMSIFIFLRKPNRAKKYIAVYGQGMLGYTVVNSAGYFAQSGDWLFLLMFTVLLFFSIFNSMKIIKYNN